ncbi:MAG: acyl--CoA ligase [Oscillospiraceae bacterium]|nr:acyl--CoA ligase [Oscillospiraceae bacterium]
MTFFEKLTENIIAEPDKTVLTDECNSFSFRDIDELSGRVYGYLKRSGYKTEDIIILKLPHSAYIPVFVLGIWKAGLCASIVSTWIDEVSLARISESTGAKLMIDEELFGEILKEPAAQGYVLAGEHDAAFIFYTSGTTGPIKGCLHEYGDLDRIALQQYDESVKYDRVAMDSPLYDLGAFSTIFPYLYYSAYVHIAPPGSFKDTEYFVETVNRYGITNSFFMPEKLRNILSGNVVERCPSLWYFSTGYEPVKRLYSEKIPVYCFYGASESYLLLSNFVIDRTYDLTPAGVPNPAAEVIILDERGEPLPGGEIGEICYRNPYMRGYLNMPEKTAELFRFGVCHTGDLGRILPDGKLMVYGRREDAAFRDGKYYIPSVIESAAEAVLDISGSTVLIIEDGDGVTAELYYEGETELDKDSAAEALLAYGLEEHLLPHRYIRLDELPKSFSGKHIRRTLRKQ